jgi:hypothetical protein
MFAVDEGKIERRRDDVSLNHLRNTFSAGFMVHAGGLPVISLLFALDGVGGHLQPRSIVRCWWILSPFSLLNRRRPAYYLDHGGRSLGIHRHESGNEC